MDNIIEHFAEVAYDEHRRTGNSHLGDTPLWEELTPRTKKHWIKIVRAIFKELKETDFGGTLQ